MQILTKQFCGRVAERDAKQLSCSINESLSFIYLVFFLLPVHLIYYVSMHSYTVKTTYKVIWCPLICMGESEKNSVDWKKFGVQGPVGPWWGAGATPRWGVRRWRKLTIFSAKNDHSWHLKWLNSNNKRQITSIPSCHKLPPHNCISVWGSLSYTGMGLRQNVLNWKYVGVQGQCPSGGLGGSTPGGGSGGQRPVAAEEFCYFNSDLEASPANKMLFSSKTNQYD